MTNRFLKKHCPKCGGNVYLTDDSYGYYEMCLQCGYTRDLEGASHIEKKIPVAQGAVRVA